MDSCRLQGSGTIIMIACGSERPDSVSSSSTLSNIDESDPSVSMTGSTFLQVVAEQARGELALARLHPVDVAAQRVDLAVVRDVAVGVRARPARERVGREARVHHRQRRLQRLVPEIRVELAQLVGVEHALVDQRARREARDVEVAAARQRRARHGLLDQAPDDVQLPLERVARPACASARRTKTWRMAGWLALAVAPSVELSVGTSRHPSSTWPSSATTASSRRTHSCRLTWSCGRNTAPAA